ncbi:MAG: hypothetical protein NZ700_08750 [Gemmataceae bacterium]|nr:hypothetical protein [Gemmataceae bacterium]MDW8265423.1 hypothetical protein [Gemmataceae bacterium]
MHSTTGALSSLALLLSFLPGEVYAPADLAVADRDHQARQVVHELVRGLLDKDLEAVMRQVAVPWFSHGEVTTDRSRLQAEFKGLIEAAPLQRLQFRVGKSEAFARLRARIQDRAQREALDRLLQRSDRLVQFKIVSDSQEEGFQGWILVQLRDSGATIVGVATGW